MISFTGELSLVKVELLSARKSWEHNRAFP